VNDEVDISLGFETASPYSSNVSLILFCEVASAFTTVADVNKLHKRIFNITIIVNCFLSMYFMIRPVLYCLKTTSI